MSAPARTPNVPTAAPGGRTNTAGFSDGFGDRTLVFDPASGSSLELLRFKPEFRDSPEFEAALRARVEQVGHLQHPSLATIQSVDRNDDGLTLVSKHVSGRRVSALLPKAHGPAFALELIRLVTPALAAIQRAGDHVAHGALSADRIIVTRDGRLVVVEHVLGSAIEALKPTRARLQELGLVVPAGPEPITFDARTDMAQLGFIALSLLLGRRLDPADYPANVQSLFDEYVQGGSSPILAGKMRGWLEKALQVSVRSFTSARDAHDAFKDLPDEMDVKISESGRGLLEFNSEPTPAPMPIPEIRNEHVVEPLKDERKDERKPHLFVANPTPARMPIPTLPAPESVSKPAVQKAPPARPFARYVPWVMGALVLVAAAEGVALFVLPYTKSSSAVVEVKSPDIARTNPVPPPATPQPVATTPTPAASVATETTPATKPTDASLAAAAPVVPSGPRFGAVTVTSPIELQVFKDGQVVGSSVGSIALGEGPHVLEFVNEALGFKYRQTVSVKNGQMTSVKIAVPNGRISINAAPWAEVLIDGAPAGETPLANLSLPIGSHEIVFRHPQLGEKKQTVVVKVEGLLKITQAMDAK